MEHLPFVTLLEATAVRVQVRAMHDSSIIVGSNMHPDACMHMLYAGQMGAALLLEQECARTCRLCWRVPETHQCCRHSGPDPGRRAAMNTEINPPCSHSRWGRSRHGTAMGSCWTTVH